MKSRGIVIILFLILIITAGCTETPQVTPTTPVITLEPVVPTQVEVPTATALPMAVLVNGEGILLSEYDSEMLRLQDALTELGKELTPEEQRNRVINGFVDELLLAQAAVKAGQEVSDEDVQARIDQLVNDLGSMEKLVEWQNTNHYTDETFKVALKRQMTTARQRDSITEGVPATAEQIHARQLFFKNESNATLALKQLEDGVDFSTLAAQQDPTLKGDLGWFPRGMLTQPEVEKAVFALQPGETTGIIASSLGYHIVNVIEREADHVLSTEARLMLQKAALNEWLAVNRAKSTIEILVP